MNEEWIVKLHSVSLEYANKLFLIGEAMEGKGVNPVDVPLVQANLKEVENMLRSLGANPKNPIPFNG
jgi:hypothetical protein